MGAKMEEQLRIGAPATDNGSSYLLSSQHTELSLAKFKKWTCLDWHERLGILIGSHFPSHVESIQPLLWVPTALGGAARAPRSLSQKKSSHKASKSTVPSWRHSAFFKVRNSNERRTLFARTELFLSFFLFGGNHYISLCECMCMVCVCVHGVCVCLCVCTLIFKVPTKMNRILKPSVFPSHMWA